MKNLVKAFFYFFHPASLAALAAGGSILYSIKSNYVNLPELLGLALIYLALLKISMKSFLFFHELFHALAASLLKIGVHRIIIGRGIEQFRLRLGKLMCIFTDIPHSGTTYLIYHDLEKYRLKTILITVAGPLFNLLVLIACLLVIDFRMFSLVGFNIHTFLIVIAFAQVVKLINNLWPREITRSMNSIPNDGLKILQLLQLKEPPEEIIHTKEYFSYIEALEKGQFEHAHTHLIKYSQLNSELTEETKSRLLIHIYLLLGDEDHALQKLQEVREFSTEQNLSHRLLMQNLELWIKLYLDKTISPDEIMEFEERCKMINFKPLVNAFTGTIGCYYVFNGDWDRGIARLRPLVNLFQYSLGAAVNAYLLAYAYLGKEQALISRIFYTYAARNEYKEKMESYMIAKIKRLIKAVNADQTK